VPKTAQDVTNTIAIAREEGATVLPRGGGTSQCGQTVNDSIVIDTTKHLNRLLELDVENRTCLVEPGIVLDELNRQLKPHGLWFPVDVSTASRATIGGMAGNNSCGGRSIRYGMMRDNVLAIDAVLADGSETTFGALEQGAKLPGFVDELLKLGEREQAEIAARFPKVMRRVGGYNIDALVPNAKAINLSSLLVGSEGTLAWSNRHQAEAVAAACQEGHGRVPLSHLPRRDGCCPAHRQAGPGGGGTGRPHHDRAWPATSPCSAPPWTGGARRARCAAAGGIRRRTGTRICAA
jgi:hypothetical protein